MAEGDGLGPLQVRVAGEEGIGLPLGDVEDCAGEVLDRGDPLSAGVGGVEAEGGRDLVVPGPSRVDLPTDGAEQPLDGGMDVLVVVGEILGTDPGERRFDLGELLLGQDPGLLKPSGVQKRPLAVVGEELGVVGPEERPHLGSERATARPR
jgi:hypothetical protein